MRHYIRISIAVGGVITLALLVSLVQEMNRKIQVQREVRALEQQAQDAERAVIELENLNEYFRTDDYQERLAREKLNYSAPGEHVILVPEDSVTKTDASTKDSPLSASIPMRWWEVFFVGDQNGLTLLTS